MSQYLLSVYEPVGPTPSAEFLAPIIANLNALNEEMKASGAWVFSNGLMPQESATVVRAQEGKVLVTDGPYIEGKEHLGGFTIIEAADLDEALSWAKKLTVATTLPIEVRPFQSHHLQ